MRRSIIASACALAVGGILATAPGCDTLKPSIRKAVAAREDEDEKSVEEGGTGRIRGFTSDGRASASPFFKNNRLKGGLSDEARDIEASLGVK